MYWLMKFCLISCLELFIVVAENIDEDYFFGESLRSETANVDDCYLVKRFYCNHKYKNHDGTCLKNKCYCIYEPKYNANDKKFLIPILSTATDKSIYPGHDLVLQPQLRHHIAHFCPNLDEARKCIRKCMIEGRPAFCGKDHIFCYCGHRYSYQQKEEKIDPAKINAGFYDLYEKYFGPDTTISNGKDKSSRLRETTQNANKHKVLLK